MVIHCYFFILQQPSTVFPACSMAMLKLCISYNNVVVVYFLESDGGQEYALLQCRVSE